MRRSSFRLVAAASAIALAVTGCSSSSDEAANTDTQFEIFTWWASGGEAAGLQGMIDVYSAQNPNTEFINAAVAGGAGGSAGVARAHPEAGAQGDCATGDGGLYRASAGLRGGEGAPFHAGCGGDDP